MLFESNRAEQIRKRVSCMDRSLDKVSRCSCWKDRDARSVVEWSVADGQVGMVGFVAGVLPVEDAGARNATEQIPVMSKRRFNLRV